MPPSAYFNFKANFQGLSQSLSSRGIQAGEEGWGRCWGRGWGHRKLSREPPLPLPGSRETLGVRHWSRGREPRRFRLWSGRCPLGEHLERGSPESGSRLYVSLLSCGPLISQFTGLHITAAASLRDQACRSPLGCRNFNSVVNSPPPPPPPKEKSSRWKFCMVLALQFHGDPRMKSSQEHQVLFIFTSF